MRDVAKQVMVRFTDEELSFLHMGMEPGENYARAIVRIVTEYAKTYDDVGLRFRKPGSALFPDWGAVRRLPAPRADAMAAHYIAQGFEVELVEADPSFSARPPNQAIPDDDGEE